MPEDGDKILAKLAVEAGFLSRDEASQYWRQAQTPGAPRMIQSLLQAGRLTPAQVEQLKTMWRSEQSGDSGRQAVAQPPPPVSAPPTGSPGLPQATLPGEVTSGFSLPSQDDAAWEDALLKDATLARVLYGRGQVTQDQLRECRQIQLQARMRLGVVLVKKGYLQRPVVEEAIREARNQMGQSEATGAFMVAPGLGAAPPPVAAPALPSHAAPLPTPSAPLPGTSPALPASPPMGDDEPTFQGFAPPRQPPAKLNNPFASVRSNHNPLLDPGVGGMAPPAFGGGSPGGPPKLPGMDEPEPAGDPLMRSMEELNPFAELRGGRAGADPPAVKGATSGDELSAFDDAPLAMPDGYGPDGVPEPADAPGAFDPGEPAEPPAPGMTPSGVPIGGQVDSDPESPKARPTKRRGMQRPNLEQPKKSNTTLYLIIGAVVVVVILVVILVTVVL